MPRKANIDNLIRDAKKADERIAEIEKMLKTAKADSAGAQNKVAVRKNELEQENNNALAKKIKSVFGDDISSAELKKQLSELLLIDEVKEYIESEKAKRKAVADNNIGTDIDRSADDIVSDDRIRQCK